jgi:site-specific recombinase XerD
MPSENASPRPSETVKCASENTETFGRENTRRGAAPTALPPELGAIHDDYIAALERTPLSAESRRTYASKVRQFLAWLAAADVDGDPFDDPAARDWAVRDYRNYLAAVLKRANATVNNTLAALDDFYTRRGLGPADAKRLDLPQAAPRALDERAAIRWLRAVRQRPLSRDRALVLTPLYAGARISEVVGLDLDDVQLSARKGTLRFYGKGGKPRLVDIHPELRTALRDWLNERSGWPGAADNPAVFLNRRGGRLSTRAASDIHHAIVENAALEDDVTAHILRHTFATALVRGGADLVVVAELVGHARLDQTRRYTLPSDEDRRQALDLLPIDR